MSDEVGSYLHFLDLRSTKPADEVGSFLLFLDLRSTKQPMEWAQISIS